MTKNEFTIGQLADEAGIATSAIRYYESEGLLPEPRRVSGRRRYGAEAVDRLSVIELAKRSGFTLAEVAALLDGFADEVPRGERLLQLAAEKEQELDRRIAEAQQMKEILGRITSCSCPSLTECGRAARSFVGDSPTG